MRKLLLLALAAAGCIYAQPATTTVADQFFMSIGGPTYCTGTFTLTWKDFYSKDGFLIKAGTSAPVTVNATGQFSVAVVPTNTNLTPAAGIYTVRYSLQPSNCAATSEYWNVPSSVSPVNLNVVRTLPTPPPSLIPTGSIAPPTMSGVFELCFQSGVVQWGTCGGSTSGITGSGTTGSLAKFTGNTAIGNASVTDIVNNFSGCSSTQYLGADGNCHTTISQLTSAAIIGLWSGCSGTELLGADGNCHSSGAGTVTSVGLSLPGIFSVSGSPVTSSGSLTAALATQSANQVWAGPTTGSAAAPTFRALVGADLPNPSASTLGGVESFAAVTHEWIRQISTSGVPTASQPAFTDISGSNTCGQLPALTGDTTTSAGSCATTTAKINGTNFPTSAALIGSNGSAQPVAASQTTVSGVGYAAGGGTANAQTVTLSPAISSYTTGLGVCWKPSNANTTTTPTLNVNAVGATTIVKAGGAALVAGDLATTAIACVRYDGTSFDLENPQTSGGGSSVTAAPPYISIGGTKYVAATMYLATLPPTSPSFINGVTPSTSGTGTNGDYFAVTTSPNPFQTQSATTSVEAEFSIGPYTNMDKAEAGIWLWDSTNSFIYDVNIFANNAQVLVDKWSYSGSGNPSLSSVLYQTSFPSSYVYHFKLSVSAGSLSVFMSMDGGGSYIALPAGTISVGTISSGGFWLGANSALTVYSLAVN